MTTDPSLSKERNAYVHVLETLATRPTHQQEDGRDGSRELSISSANLALDDYNKHNHTNYELVEYKALASNSFTHHGEFKLHCSFYAKDFITDLFFAEICLVSPFALAITCMILKGQTYVGCEYCHSFIIHPVDGYQLAAPNYSPRASLSISGHDEDPLKVPNLDMEIVRKDEDSADKYNLFPATISVYQQEDSSEGSIDSPNHPASPPYSPVDVSASGQLFEGSPEDHIKYANIALDYYNNKNKTNFKLVEDAPMDSNFFVDDCAHCVHCFFNATDSSMTQFFAEIRLRYQLQPLVKTCEILEGKCYVGCEYCRLFIHPFRGNLAGAFIYKLNYEDDCHKEFVNTDYDYGTPDSPTYSAIYPSHPPDSPDYEMASPGY